MRILPHHFGTSYNLRDVFYQLICYGYDEGKSIASIPNTQGLEKLYLSHIMKHHEELLQSSVLQEQKTELDHWRLYVGWLHLVYFASGICSLIDQIIWIRLLKLVFGNTVYATSIVVSVFLGGLALGSAVVSSSADRTKRPLNIYALLETLITIATLLFPLALRVAELLYVYIYRRFALSSSGILVVQVIISLCIILLPTMLMGARFPFLGRYVSLFEKHIGFSVGRLYAINMLGASAGAFLAGFVLVRYYGVWVALYFSASLNALVAISAWYLARLQQHKLTSQTSKGKNSTPAEWNQSDSVTKRNRYLLLVTVFVSGFVSIGYEIIWTRTVIPLLSGDTYVFSSILTVYLAVNVIGVWIGSKLARKANNPVLLFGTFMILIGIFGLIYIPFLAMFASKIFSPIDKLCVSLLDNFAPSWSNLSTLASSFILFSIPSLMMGIGFPLSLETWHRKQSEHGAGHSTAWVYTINTVGCVAGGLCTGLLAIPIIGSQYTVQLLGVLGAISGGLLVCCYIKQTPLRISYALCPSIVSAILILLTPSDLFYRKTIVYGSTKLVAVKEGPNTIVSVHKSPNGHLWLCASGLQVAGDELKCVQRVLGHFGYLIHPSARTVLSVGFGSGETTRCLSLHKPERIDCVEIAPEIVEVSLKYFTHRNLGPALTNHVRMIYMDAKNYLKLTDQRYDLIITDSISPKAFAENASLYTKEYFINAVERLNENGVVLCWAPFNIPTNCFESILGTFQEIFPYVTVWFPVVYWDHFVLLTGSMKPFTLEPQQISIKLNQSWIRADLNEIKIFDINDVLACYLGDKNDIQRWLKNNYTLNSDFRPYVEFATGKFLMTSEKWRYLYSLANTIRSLSVTNYIRLTVPDAHYNTELFIHDLTMRYMFDNITYKLNSGYDIFVNPEHEHLLKINLTDYLRRHVSYVDGHIIYGTILNGNGHYEDAIQHLTQALTIDPQNGFALNQRGLARLMSGDIKQAKLDFNKSAECAPYYYMPYYNLGVINFQLQRYEDAIRFLTTAIQLRPSIPSMFIQRGLAYMALKQFTEAVSDFSSAIELHYQRLDVPYFHRGAAHFIMKNYNNAISDLNESIKLNPNKSVYYSARSAVHCELGNYMQAWHDIQKCTQLGGKPDSNTLQRVRSHLNMSR